MQYHEMKYTNDFDSTTNASDDEKYNDDVLVATAVTKHETAMSRLEISIAKTISKLEDEREKRAVRLCQYEEKETMLQQKLNKLEQYWIKRRNMDSNNNDNNMYTKAMEEMNSKRRMFTGSIIHQQAKLCQSLHQLEHYKKDLSFKKDIGILNIRYLHEQLKSLNEERTINELNIMNQLCRIEKDIHETRSKKENEKIIDSYGDTEVLVLLDDDITDKWRERKHSEDNITVATLDTTISSCDYVYQNNNNNDDTQSNHDEQHQKKKKNHPMLIRQKMERKTSFAGKTKFMAPPPPRPSNIIRHYDRQRSFEAIAN